MVLVRRTNLLASNLGEERHMPKIIFETLDLVPEWLRGDAKEVNGKIEADVVQTAKVDEFRNNNIKLSTERDALLKTNESLVALVGEDVEAFKTEIETLRKTQQEVNDGKLKGSDAVAKEVESRVQNLKTDYEKQIQAANKETVAYKDKAATLETKLKNTHIDRAITSAVLDENSGVDPRALPDILERARRVYTVEGDDKLVAKDGEAVIYGSDGATPLPPSEWLEKLKEQAPYFFKSSQGGGATGSDGKLPAGLTQEQYDKLSGSEKLALSRKAQAQRR